MKNKIQTFSLSHHKSLFSTEDNKEYFYIHSNEHPYISEPYRAESYAIEYLRKGSIIMQTQLEKIIVHAPAIIALAPSVMRSFTKNSDEILIDIVFFKPEFFLENQTNVFFLSQYDFFEKNNVCQLENDTEIKFEQLFNFIAATVNGDSQHQASILRSYLYILIYEIDTLLQKSGKETVQNLLFEKFKEILVKDFLSQRAVQYYADRLNVSRKYLSETIKRNSGKTASAWINETVVLEAKVLLQDKSLTINQVSDVLHFQTQSDFGRFFKNHTGISPLEYRR